MATRHGHGSGAGAGAGAGGGGGDDGAREELREMALIAACQFRDFHIDDVVAMGANGAVCRASCTRAGLKDRTFAFKAIFNMGVTNTAAAGFYQYEAEYNLLAGLERHPNVLRFYTQYREPVPPELLPRLPEFVREAATMNPHTGRPRSRPLPNQWVVFEWLPETVQAWTQRQWEAAPAGTEALPWQDVARMGLGICYGLMHLQEHHIVHRDLKTDNVMVKAGGTPVIADFGTAVETGEDGVYHVHMGQAVGGNTAHLGPEVNTACSKLARLREAGSFVAVPYDKQPTFALGVLLHEMAMGEHPIVDYPASVETRPDGPREPAVFTYNLQGEDAVDVVWLPEAYPAAMRELGQSMIECEPARRPELAKVAATLERVLAEGKAGEDECVCRCTPELARLRAETLRLQGDVGRLEGEVARLEGENRTLQEGSVVYREAAEAQAAAAREARAAAGRAVAQLAEVRHTNAAQLAEVREVSEAALAAAREDARQQVQALERRVGGFRDAIAAAEKRATEAEKRAREAERRVATEAERRVATEAERRVTPRHRRLRSASTGPSLADFFRGAGGGGADNRPLPLASCPAPFGVVCDPEHDSGDDDDDDDGLFGGGGGAAAAAPARAARPKTNLAHLFGGMDDDDDCMGGLFGGGRAAAPAPAPGPPPAAAAATPPLFGSTHRGLFGEPTLAPAPSPTPAPAPAPAPPFAEGLEDGDGLFGDGGDVTDVYTCPHCMADIRGFDALVAHVSECARQIRRR